VNIIHTIAAHNVSWVFTYLSVEVEIAEDHEHSTDFGEQRPEDESGTERQKIRTALEMYKSK